MKNYQQFILKLSIFIFLISVVLTGYAGYQIFFRTESMNLIMDTCIGNDYDKNPDIDELLRIIKQPTNIRAVVYVDDKQQSEIFGYVGNDIYKLEGVNFKKKDSGRLVELTGETFTQNLNTLSNYDNSFKVSSFKIIPFTVLRGIIKKNSHPRGGEYYLFTTNQSNRKYTFALESNTIDLSKLEGKTATIAGVIKFTDLSSQARTFFVNKVCKL